MDCTGCGVCAVACPDNALAMRPFGQLVDAALPPWDYARALTTASAGRAAAAVDRFTPRGSQFRQPLLEFSGACAGCGQTPYVKLLTQLYGDRMVIANASGCSSVWGGTATTNPYTYARAGRCGLRRRGVCGRGDLEQRRVP